ncbi:MAG: hypothetical protein AAFZ52_15825 [Bacteroidota bacterium]
MTTPDIAQTFSFSAARLTAPSLHALLGNLHELRLEVTAGGQAHLLGYGYREDAAYAFTRVLHDWRARTQLDFDPGLPAGKYSLDWRGEVPMVFVDGSSRALPDGPATVRLTGATEEE